MNKTYQVEGEVIPESQIGATLEALAATIASRRNCAGKSYTKDLLQGSEDSLLKKVVEEAGELVLAAKQVSMIELVSGPGFEQTKPAVPDKEELAKLKEADRRGAEAPDYDEAIDHLRYEAADVLYHLLVVLERYHIGLEELAAELNSRMTDTERPEGAVLLHEEHIKREV